jgi:hypothetical protein
LLSSSLFLRKNSLSAGRGYSDSYKSRPLLTMSKSDYFILDSVLKKHV